MRSSRTVRNLPQAVSAPVGGHNGLSLTPRVTAMWVISDTTSRQMSIPPAARRLVIARASSISASPAPTFMNVVETSAPFRVFLNLCEIDYRSGSLRALKVA
jgi:hypothetical protein